MKKTFLLVLFWAIILNVKGAGLVNYPPVTGVSNTDLIMIERYDASTGTRITSKMYGSNLIASLGVSISNQVLMALPDIQTKLDKIYLSQLTTNRWTNSTVSGIKDLLIYDNFERPDGTNFGVSTSGYTWEVLNILNGTRGGSTSTNSGITNEYFSSKHLGNVTALTYLYYTNTHIQTGSSTRPNEGLSKVGMRYRRSPGMSSIDTGLYDSAVILLASDMTLVNNVGLHLVNLGGAALQLSWWTNNFSTSVNFTNYPGGLSQDPFASYWFNNNAVVTETNESTFEFTFSGNWCTMITGERKQSFYHPGLSNIIAQCRVVAFELVTRTNASQRIDIKEVWAGYNHSPIPPLGANLANTFDERVQVGFPGTTNLSSGVATVTAPWVKTNSQILVTPVATANPAAACIVSNIVAGTSFKVHSTSGSDGNRIDYRGFNPD